MRPATLAVLVVSVSLTDWSATPKSRIFSRPSGVTFRFEGLTSR
jgi:hypothetical protein